MRRRSRLPRSGTSSRSAACRPGRGGSGQARPGRSPTTPGRGSRRCRGSNARSKAPACRGAGSRPCSHHRGRRHRSRSPVISQPNAERTSRTVARGVCGEMAGQQQLGHRAPRPACPQQLGVAPDRAHGTGLASAADLPAVQRRQRREDVRAERGPVEVGQRQCAALEIHEHDPGALGCRRRRAADVPAARRPPGSGRRARRRTGRCARRWRRSRQCGSPDRRRLGFEGLMEQVVGGQVSRATPKRRRRRRMFARPAVGASPPRPRATRDRARPVQRVADVDQERGLAVARVAGQHDDVELTVEDRREQVAVELGSARRSSRAKVSSIPRLPALPMLL